MKLTVYKAKETLERIESVFEDNNYKKKGQEKYWKEQGVRMTLYMDIHEKNAPGWVKEVLDFFDTEELEDYTIPDQYNAIIVVQTMKNIYLLPQGRAYWTVEKLADMNFGLNFAEKTILDKDISLKGVSYIQRNKMKGVTNYKQNQTEFPQASESYFSVSGKPRSESIFGSNLTCGTGITFAREYSLNKGDEQEDEFIDLFGQIDIALSLKGNISSIPRLIKINKKDPLNTTLDTQLLGMIKKIDDNISISFSISKIQLLGNRIIMLESDKKLTAYVTGSKKETEEEISIDGDQLKEYIIKYSDLINDISKLKFSVFDEEDCITKDVPFKKIVFCELQMGDKVYLLDNGMWGHFNNRFYSLVEEKMKEINDIIDYNDEYSCQYESDESGEYAGEGGYIEALAGISHMVKLHKRNINTHGTYIEVADIFNRNSKELLAIKRGTGTSMALYSFEQSLLSMQVLSNSNEFKVRDELLKYNDRKKYDDVKKYPNLTKKQLGEIMECKTSCVLWLIDQKVTYVYEGVRNKNLDLLKFNSILLKLKIIDWYSFTKDNGYTPKIYFALDLPLPMDVID
ncbi:TIGR04141 family sporadically distributed protein [Listeria grandensis]|nr:TIGR04141 family sporadically distributed protein [Listeria grandensis]